MRSWRPFQWEIGGQVHPGVNTLEIQVANTGANYLAGDPQRYREIDAKGWVRNSYIRMYLKFDTEMISSGLFGPVRILREMREP